MTSLTDTSDCGQIFLKTTAGQLNFSGTAAKRQMTGSVSEIPKLGSHAQKKCPNYYNCPKIILLKSKLDFFQPGNCHLMKENFM